MICGMLSRNRKAFAARCVMVWLAGFPSAPTVRTARAATEVSLPNQSTLELKIHAYGPPALLPVSPHQAGASSEPTSTPLTFELHERYQIVAPGAIGPLERL